MKARPSSSLITYFVAFCAFGLLILLALRWRGASEVNSKPIVEASRASLTSASGKPPPDDIQSSDEPHPNGPADKSEPTLRKRREQEAKFGIVIDSQNTFDSDRAALKRIFQDYYRVLGEFPSGDSTAFVQALRGNNKKQMPFISPTGNLLDPWQTPYHFSRGDGVPVVEVLSAGPDKALWSNDDVVFEVGVPRR